MGRSLTNELPKNAVLRLPPPSDDCSFYKSRRQEIGWLGGRLLPCKQNFWRRNVLITKTNLLRVTWSPRVTLWTYMASWTWETSRRWTTPRWRSPSKSRSGEISRKRTCLFNINKQDVLEGRSYEVQQHGVGRDGRERLREAPLQVAKRPSPLSLSSLLCGQAVCSPQGPWRHQEDLEAWHLHRPVHPDKVKHTGVGH